jgi:glycosyltransferase involved in cell wall biosynthesis
MKSTLVLLTKTYPYGHLETYLNNEIPILITFFDELIIIPVEEFDYQHLNDLCSNNPKIIPLRVNENLQSLGYRVLIQLYSMINILREVFSGREPLEHIKRLKMCFVYSKLAYAQAHVINEYIKRNYDYKQVKFYSYWLHKSVLVLKGIRKLAKSEIDVTSRAHSSDLYHKNWAEIMRTNVGVFIPFEKTKLSTCDKVISISQHGLNHFNRTFPALTEKFKLSRLGVLRQSKLSPITNWEKFRIVTCSAIQPHKRIDRIPEILAQLKDLTIEWVHFGSGDAEDEALLNQEIRKFKVQQNVVLKMHVSHREILNFYSTEQVNVILNLSYAEGIPVSLMEAISFGIPGIATNAIGNPEIIDSSCGFQIPVEFSAEEVSHLIRKMFNDPELQKRLRDGALAMYEERYSAEKNYSDFAAILRS